MLCWVTATHILPYISIIQLTWGPEKWKRKSLSHVHLFVNPMDCSLPGSSVHGILQARILEWVAIPFSRASSQPKDWTQVSCISGRFSTVWESESPEKPYSSSNMEKRAQNQSTLHNRKFKLEKIRILLSKAFTNKKGKGGEKCVQKLQGG